MMPNGKISFPFVALVTPSMQEMSDDNKKYLSTDLAGAEPVRAGYIAPEIELIGFQSIPFTS